MLKFDNLEEYQNPDEYDCEYGEYGPSGLFYEGLAREFGGPVLELGCGTGRVTIPMARAGFAITGLDLDTGMLERAISKSTDLPVRWLQGDFTSFQLGEQYRLVFITANAWQHLLDRTAQEAALARVREHLAPGGVFAFETRNPSLQHLFSDPEETPWHTFTDQLGQTVQVSRFRSYDHVEQVQTFTVNRRYPDGTARTTRIALRYTFPQEMAALMHYSGLSVLRCYGDWDGGPLTASSVQMVYVCQAL